MVLAAFVVDAVPVEDVLEEVIATTTMGVEVECEDTPAMIEDVTMEALEEVELV